MAVVQFGGPIELANLESGTVTRLLPPRHGQVEESGFDATGTPILLCVDANSSPAMAFAFRLTAQNRWKQLERKETTLEGDFTDGTEVLRTKIVSPKKDPARGGWNAPATEGVKDVRLLARLNALFPGMELDPDGWGLLSGLSPPAYLYFGSGEGMYPTDLLVFQQGRALVRAPDPTHPLSRAQSSNALVEVIGPFVLVAGGDGSRPRVYDVRTAKAVFSSDSGVGAHLWVR